MNGRIKPRFEDLATATLQKPKIVDLPRVILEPTDHTQVLTDFRNNRLFRPAPGTLRTARHP